MTVVSDTSPVCYLTLIGYLDVLPALFGRVEVPEAVASELSAADAPPQVSQLMAHTPAWLAVHRVAPEPDAELSRLHAGEREAVLLAERLNADLIVLDERIARRIAAHRGLRVTGTLGILKAAAERGMVDLPVAVERLKRTNFRASPRLLQLLLRGHS
jgi:predicted nucleic acid-binding protein